MTPSQIASEYQDLLVAYLRGSIEAEVLQERFFRKFKSEQRPLTAGLFDVLEGAFGELDAFTREERLAREDPASYIDENALKARIEQLSKRLGDWL